MTWLLVRAIAYFSPQFFDSQAKGYEVIYIRSSYANAHSLSSACQRKWEESLLSALYLLRCTLLHKHVRKPIRVSCHGYWLYWLYWLDLQQSITYKLTRQKKSVLLESCSRNHISRTNRSHFGFHMGLSHVRLDGKHTECSQTVLGVERSRTSNTVTRDSLYCIFIPISSCLIIFKMLDCE